MRKSTNSITADGRAPNVPEHRHQRFSAVTHRLGQRRTTALEAFPKVRMRVRFPTSAPISKSSSGTRSRLVRNLASPVIGSRGPSTGPRLVVIIPLRPLNTGRKLRGCRNDAAFAALSGTSPLAGQQRQDGPASAQPRRRPSPQQRDPHHRHHPHAMLPGDQGVCSPTPSRGQDQP